MSFASLGREAARHGVLGKKTKEMQDLDDAPLQMETADGCTPAQLVALVTRDGVVIEAARAAACRCVTIKNMLEDTGGDEEDVQ